MSSSDRTCQPSLPKDWTGFVKTAVLHTISLAHLAVAHARGWAANSINARVRQAAEIERLRAEVAMLHEELRIKDARMAVVLPHRRPHYPPFMRMAILELKAARGWNLAQASQRFLVEPATIAAWLNRLEESGPAALVQIAEPVNKLPLFVRHIVARLKALCPAMGKVKIAQMLARAGMHLGATTVKRMLAGEGSKPKLRPVSGEIPAKAKPDRVVTAKYPNHIWHVDLTVMPTGGFWAPWLPFALPQCWPFCWWLAVVLDHFSRKVMGIGVFRKQPDARQVREVLDRTIRGSGAKPKYIVCDKGKQFWCMPFKRWCRRRKIKPRFGAIGKHGSIAVIERFILSMKEEFLRRIIVPLNHRRFQEATFLYTEWYNRFRPHEFLDGRTPEERHRRIPAACRRPRFEPRPHWPRDAICASPQAKVRGQPGVKLELHVERHGGDKNLPVVTLTRAA